jgi:hypothetical protein
MAFASAFVVLIGSILGSHVIVTAIVGGGNGHHAVHVASGVTRPAPTRAAIPTVGLHPIPERIPTSTGPARANRLPAATPITTVPVVVATPVPALTEGQQISVAIAPPLPAPAALAPASNPELATAGNASPPLGATAEAAGVRLSNYWVASTSARPGQTLTVHYVIENSTGVTLRLWLGASIKPVRIARWSAEAISDPEHDVVATVPVGLTTHMRYFTLSPQLSPGIYDVAWGLRDGRTGERVTLATATGVLRVGG